MNQKNESAPFILAKEEDGIIIVQMGGVLNSLTLPQTRELVDEIIKNHQIYKRNNLKILIDYQYVVDVDSSTVANILERLSEHEKRQHTLALVNVPKEFKKLIEIHKLQDTVTIYDSMETAMTELKKPTQ